MNIASRIATLGLAGSFVVACRGSSAETSTPPPAHHEGASGKALDSRTPLPLTAMMATHQKQEMRDHLRVIQEITTALATDDFDAIAKSASRIGASLSSPMAPLLFIPLQGERDIRHGNSV